MEMRKYTRRILTGLLLAVVSVPVGAADATSAATPQPTVRLAANESATHSAVTPAATCGGNTCDGKDPVAAGCTSGALPYASASTTINSSVESVTVYYSPTCGVGYAEFVDPNYQNEVNDPPTMAAFSVPQFGGPETLLGTGSISGDTVYSVMIHWDVSIKACYLTEGAAAGPYDPAPDITTISQQGFCTRWT